MVARMEREELGQRIRWKAHELDLALKDGDSGSGDRDGLAALLGEWRQRGYVCGPDILWAERRLSGQQAEAEGYSGQFPGDVSSDLFEVLRQRRSIRFWQPKAVPSKTTTALLEAALQAPSSFHRLTCRFVAVHNRPDAMVRGDTSNASMLAKAPLSIFIAVDERLYEERLAPAMDAALAAQGILLAGWAFGLGGCLLYQGEIADQARLRERFRLEAHHTVQCAVLLGFPAEMPEKPGRPDVAEVCTFIRL